MEAGTGTGQGEPAPRRLAAAFVAALVLYYAAYYVVFSGRLGEYVNDLRRHFEFVRRLL